MTATPPSTDIDDDEPKREYSVPRVTLALLVLLALIGGTAFAIDRSTSESTAPPLGAWTGVPA